MGSHICNPLCMVWCSKKFFPRCTLNLGLSNLWNHEPNKILFTAQSLVFCYSSIKDRQSHSSPTFSGIPHIPTLDRISWLRWTCCCWCHIPAHTKVSVFSSLLEFSLFRSTHFLLSKFCWHLISIIVFFVIPFVLVGLYILFFNYHYNRIWREIINTCSDYYV